jgi:hypothetical protein
MADNRTNRYVFFLQLALIAAIILIVLALALSRAVGEL